MTIQVRIFRIINFFIKPLLRSHLHSILSNHAMIVEFKGHKTGKNRAIPVGYFIEGGNVYCFIDGGPWWRNFIEGQDVTLILRGQRITAFAKAMRDNKGEFIRVLSLFLEADPKNIGYFKMETSTDGKLEDGELERAFETKAMVKFTTEAKLPEQYRRNT